MIPNYTQKKRYVFSRYYVREIAMVLLSCTTLFLLFSLFTYLYDDPSWFYYNDADVAVRNVCGIVGAQCAALFFYLFGFSSYWLVFLNGFIIFLLLKQRSFAEEWERVAAIGIALVVTATSTHLFHVGRAYAIVPGGFLGARLSALLYGWFDMVGSILLLTTLALVSLILFGRFSFERMMHGAQCVGNFVTSKERCWIPLYKGATGAIYYGSVPLRIVGSYGYRLLNGTLLGEPAEQIVQNEYELFTALKSASKKTEFEYTESPAVPQQLDFIEDSSQETMRSMENYNFDDAMHEPQKPTAASAWHETPITRVSNHHYRLPNLDIFMDVSEQYDDEKIMKDLQQRAVVLEEKLQRFGVSGTVSAIKRGPVVTLFEYEPDIDSKISKIVSLEDDLAMTLQALSIRIIAPIPGRSVVGFEVANKERKSVYFADVIRSDAYAKFKGGLPLILGKDTIGNDVVVDLIKMPHLLIAGSTGSGKSVALNVMLVSLLCKKSPDELRLILIDPKRLEFSSYADIAHLLFPIITDVRKVTPVLKWVVKQMEERYEKMAQCGVRNMQDYNERMQHDASYEKMPYIVVIIDELADLMMTAGREVEDLITRLAQMARAAGIHLIVATQRPSVEVITGLIKVNFPSRISFRVTSKIDSRTILDAMGADKLLGKGDMLFMGSNEASLARIHGAYVSDKEIEDVVNHIRKERPVQYLDLHELVARAEEADLSDADDALLEQVIAFLDEVDEVSISLVQRRFRIGYNRSARLIDLLEARGMITAADGSRTRKVIRMD